MNYRRYNSLPLEFYGCILYGLQKKLVRQNPSLFEVAATKPQLAQMETQWVFTNAYEYILVVVLGDKLQKIFELWFNGWMFSNPQIYK
jgi:hypothetical protein